MPQLTGPEQKILVELLVAHLSDPSQLHTALLHAGIGNLSNFSQKGTLDSMTSELVQALSSQYRIVEFVESVLTGDFLKGHCPPIEAWLESNRSEFVRRKNNPTIIERLGRVCNPLWSPWKFLSIAAVVVALTTLSLFPLVRTPIGPLQGQMIDLQNSAPLISIYQSRPTRGMRDLTDEIGQRADAGAFGSVFFCNPLDSSIKSPTVEVQVINSNGQRLTDPDGSFEIHWLPPDLDREEMGRWGPKLHLLNGIITDRYDGLLPAGTIITVVYQRKVPLPFPLTFNVWLK